MKPLFSLLTSVIIILAFSFLVTAGSCGNSGGGGNNNSGGGDNGGDGNGGNNTVKDCTSTTCLELDILDSWTVGTTKVNTYARVENKNTITVSAQGLADATEPTNTASNDPVWNIRDSSKNNSLFQIKYPGDKTALFFIVRSTITKDKIVLQTDTACNRREDEVAAREGGGNCIRPRDEISDNAGKVGLPSYLGTVFQHTTLTARGMIMCEQDMKKVENGAETLFNLGSILTHPTEIVCDLGVINHLDANKAQEIDNTWITGAKVTETTLYAIGIDISGQTIKQWFPGANAFTTLKDLASGFDNTAFQKLLTDRPWADLTFKVKVVPSGAF